MTFVKNNESQVLEICGLDEMGYKLAPTQRELTIPQKMFLFAAYPVFNEFLKKQAKEKEDSNNSNVGKSDFRSQYKQLRERKKQKFKKKK